MSGVNGFVLGVLLTLLLVTMCVGPIVIEWSELRQDERERDEERGWREERER